MLLMWSSCRFACCNCCNSVVWGCGGLGLVQCKNEDVMRIIAAAAIANDEVSPVLVWSQLVMVQSFEVAVAALKWLRSACCCSACCYWSCCALLSFASAALILIPLLLLMCNCFLLDMFWLAGTVVVLLVVVATASQPLQQLQKQQQHHQQKQCRKRSMLWTTTNLTEPLVSHSCLVGFCCCFSMVSLIVYALPIWLLLLLLLVIMSSELVCTLMLVWSAAVDVPGRICSCFSSCFSTCLCVCVCVCACMSLVVRSGSLLPLFHSVSTVAAHGAWWLCCCLLIFLRFWHKDSLSHWLGHYSYWYYIAVIVDTISTLHVPCSERAESRSKMGLWTCRVGVAPASRATLTTGVCRVERNNNETTTKRQQATATQLQQWQQGRCVLLFRGYCIFKTWSGWRWWNGSVIRFRSLLAFWCCCAAVALLLMLQLGCCCCCCCCFCFCCCCCCCKNAWLSQMGLA